MRAPRETGGEERRSAMARSKTGGKRWKNHSLTHGAAVGSEETHVGCCSRSASAAAQDCAVQQPEGSREGRGGEGRLMM